MASFWFAVHFFWTVVLSVFVQSRLEELRELGRLPFPEGTSLALILASGALFSIAVQLSVGFLSDHTVGPYGRRKPYLVSGALMAVAAIFALFLSPSFISLLLSYLGVQFAVNFASVPYQSYLPDLVPPTMHARASAYLGVAHLSGKLLGLISFALLVFFSAPRVVLPATFALVFLAAAAITVRGVGEGPAEEPVTELDLRRVRHLLPRSRLVFPALPEEGLWSAAWRRFADFSLPTGGDFFWVWLSRLVAHLGFYTFLDFLYYYVRSGLNTAGLIPGMEDPQQVLTPLILVVAVLAGYLGNWLAGLLGDRYHKRTLIWLSLALGAVSLVGFILTESYFVALVMAVGMGAGWGAFLTLDWAYATTLMTPEKSGRFMGLWDVSTLLPQVAASTISGLALDRLSSLFLAQGLSPQVAEAQAVRLIFFSIIFWFALASLLLIRVRSGAPLASTS